MKHKFGDKGILVKLERGEEVTETLTRFLEENHIESGLVTGIGAIEEVELGYFDREHKTYLKRTVSSEVELVHYSGNISLLEGKPIIHAHAVVSGPDFQPLAGHFFSARVAVTGEFVVISADWKAERKRCPSTGLNLLDL